MLRPQTPDDAPFSEPIPHSDTTRLLAIATPLTVAAENEHYGGSSREPKPLSLGQGVNDGVGPPRCLRQTPKQCWGGA